MTCQIPDHIMASYAAGSLPDPFALVVATHVSMSPDSRASLEAHQALGGSVLELMGGETLSAGLKDSVLAALDDPFEPTPQYARSGVYPAPVMAAMNGRGVAWKNMGGGVRQDIVAADQYGTARLLYIPPGMAVPDHGHNGLEMTLVLQGSFSDETGHFGVGDIEIANEDLDHTPIAGPGEACICLAATDAPLRFRALIPRLLQPLFKI